MMGLRILPRGRRGSIALEYALLLPVLLLFIVGIMEVGRLMWTQTTLDRAVEAAARCAAVDQITCADAPATANYAVTQAFGLNVTSDAFTVAPAACGKSVTVTFSYKFLVPFITPQSMTLHAVACYPLAG
jgi:Flp pilus assembly protein TadG